MEGLEIYTVELYLKVRLACADGMSKRAAARHFNISRDTVDKAMAFSIPPGYRRTAPVKRPKLDGFIEIIDSWLDGDKGMMESLMGFTRAGAAGVLTYFAPRAAKLRTAEAPLQ